MEYWIWKLTVSICWKWICFTFFLCLFVAEISSDSVSEIHTSQVSETTRTTNSIPLVRPQLSFICLVCTSWGSNTTPSRIKSEFTICEYHNLILSYICVRYVMTPHGANQTSTRTLRAFPQNVIFIKNICILWCGLEHLNNS